jgi:hypothetical protein
MDTSGVSYSPMADYFVGHYYSPADTLTPQLINVKQLSRSSNFNAKMGFISEHKDSTYFRNGVFNNEE